MDIESSLYCGSQENKNKNKNKDKDKKIEIRNAIGSDDKILDCSTIFTVDSKLCDSQKIDCIMFNEGSLIDYEFLDTFLSAKDSIHTLYLYCQNIDGKELAKILSRNVNVNKIYFSDKKYYSGLTFTYDRLWKFYFQKTPFDETIIFDLLKHDCIDELCIDDYIFDKSKLSIPAEATKFQTGIFINCGIEDKDVVPLFGANQFIETLCLGGNLITQEGLSQLIKNRSNLRKLHIDHNRISFDGIQKDPFEDNKKLIEVNLSGNQIHHLDHVLEKNKSIKAFDLGFNDITNIKNFLQNNDNTSLEFISFYDNKNLHNIDGFLNDNKSVINVVVSQCKIKTLCKSFVNSNVRVVNAYNCDIPDQELIHFLEAYPKVIMLDFWVDNDKTREIIKTILEERQDKSPEVVKNEKIRYVESIYFFIFIKYNQIIISVSDTYNNSSKIRNRMVC